jgi:GTPase SAR1 family protein
MLFTLHRAGQERYRSLGTAFYRGADAVALVYDVTNRKSFDELEEWVHDFLDKSGLHDKKLPHPLPFFLVANKVDCDESMVEVSPHEARDLVDRLTKDEALQVVSGMELIETSAQLNTGVAELFEGSAVKCLKNAASESAYSDRDVFVVPDVRSSSRNNG